VKNLKVILRQLQKSPGFGITAVLTLTLGIGATTAMFTLVYDVLLKPLPFEHPDQLVTIQEKVAEWSNVYPTLPVSANHFAFWQRYNHSFKAMAVMEQYSTPVGLGEVPLQIGILSATPGLFQVLQVKPEIGRPFGNAEAQRGHEHVALLLFDLWRNRFGSDPHIVGKTITLDGFPHTVIGVMPESFHMPSVRNVATFGNTNRPVPLGVIVPLAFSKDQLAEEMGDLNYFGLGRLNPGVSLGAATSEMNELQHTISRNLPADEKSTLSIFLAPFQEELVGNDRKPLIILLAAVLGLLLVGCVNITNLLLARAVGQRQQIAIAAALGASPAEMLKLAVRETVFLALVGGLLGILLAANTMPVMQRYLPPALDFRGPLHLDWAGAACAILSCLMAMLMAGAAPVFMVSRTAPHAVLHSEARLSSESRSTRRARRTLVVVEVAVSVALVMMTGLLTVSLVKLLHVNRGFSVEQTLTAMVDLPSRQYPDRGHRAAFYRQVLDKLANLPGVRHAAITSVLPLTGDSWGDMAQLPGDNRPITQLPLESFRWTSPEYFATIQLPLLSGRSFTAGDWGQNLAVISSKTAKTLWPAKDPLGQQFKRAGNPDEKPFTVIGVVADARTISLANPDPMLIYVPYWFRCDDSAGLIVRTNENLASIADAIRQTISGIDRTVPVPTVRALGSIVADSVANQRFEMRLLLFFAASALFLAGLGVYGIVTYSVVQRHREIGLRFALGAQRSHVYQLVLRDGLLPVVTGTALGLAMAFGMARLVSSMLFNISPHDPLLTIGSAFLLLAVGAAACLIPARRATAVDPLQALRAE
jgi:predicted permease